MVKHPRVKGSKNLKKVLDWFRLNGWLIDSVEKTGRFVKVKDLYGLFDAVGIRDGVVCFLQVTSNRPHSHKLYEKFSQEYEGEWIKIYQAVVVDRKGIKLFEYVSGKRGLLLDENSKATKKR